MTMPSKELFYQGVAFFKAGAQEKAIQCFTQAIEADKACAPAYYYRGLSYAMLKEYSRSITDYSEAIAIVNCLRGLNDNNLPAIGLDFAKLYLSRGVANACMWQTEKALEDFTKAIELKPKYAEAYFQRGKLYLGNNKFVDAVADLSKAIEINPKYLEAYQERRQAYGILNNIPKATEDLNRAIALTSDMAASRVRNNRPTGISIYLGKDILPKVLDFFSCTQDDLKGFLSVKTGSPRMNRSYILFFEFIARHYSAGKKRYRLSDLPLFETLQGLWDKYCEKRPAPASRNIMRFQTGHSLMAYLWGCAPQAQFNAYNGAMKSHTADFCDYVLETAQDSDDVHVRMIYKSILGFRERINAYNKTPGWKKVHADKMMNYLSAGMGNLSSSEHRFSMSRIDRHNKRASDGVSEFLHAAAEKWAREDAPEKYNKMVEELGRGNKDVFFDLAIAARAGDGCKKDIKRAAVYLILAVEITADLRAKRLLPSFDFSESMMAEVCREAEEIRKKYFKIFRPVFPISEETEFYDFLCSQPEWSNPGWITSGEVYARAREQQQPIVGYMRKWEISLEDKKMLQLKIGDYFQEVSSRNYYINPLKTTSFKQKE